MKNLLIIMAGVLIMVGCVDESEKKCEQSMTKIQTEEKNLIFYNKYKSYELALESVKKMIPLSKEVAANCKGVEGSKSQDEIKKSIQTYISLEKQFKEKIDAIKKLEKIEHAETDRLLVEIKKYKPEKRRSIVSSKQTRVRARKDVILNNCRTKWKTDYSMVKYCVDKQTKAKHSLPRQSSTILSNCKAKWKTDYSMIKYCVDKQTKAKRSLGL